MNRKRKLTSLFSAGALLAALALPARCGQRSPRGESSSAPSAQPAPAPPEEHPQIEAALAALRNSKEHLEHAAGVPSGGHRRT